MFEKYQHVERFGHRTVEGIENGTCHVFPKIDGTNASVWWEHGRVWTGSRKRELSLDSDNHGFCKAIGSDLLVRNMLEMKPHLRLFGEWLVPHSLKTYREDAWRKFYVFDVMDREGYLTYEEYQPILERYGVNYIPCIRIVENGTEDIFRKIAETNDYLMQPGEIGEGVVVKNYDYKNCFGHTTWAKIVRSEFKEKHIKAMGPPVMLAAQETERKIANRWVTQTLVDKERAKIDTDPIQPRLLSTIYHCILTEEIVDIIKKLKNPTIDFRALQGCVNAKVKELASDLF